MKLKLSVIAVVLALCACSFGIGYIEGEKVLPSIEDIQTRIGCEKIDGILGPETQAKWNEQIFNGYARKAWKEAERN